MNQVPMDEERNLDQLLAAYRDGLPVVEPSAEFMPRLWERIESRQSGSRQLWRWANSLAAAAALASLFVVMLQMFPQAGKSFYYSATYLETLASQHDNEEALNTLAMAGRGVDQEYNQQ
jgi:hypothetical protein